MATRRKPVGPLAGPNLGHGPGQICPFVWQWFKGADLVAQGWQMAPLIARDWLAEWYARFLALTPDPVTPQGIEHYPDLEAMLAAHRAGRGAKA